MRDKKTENLLERGKFAFRFVEKVRIVDIDLAEAGNDNPARLYRKLDDERCLELAMQMENGVEFPAVVLFDNSDGAWNSPSRKKYSIATGMHRLTAAQLAKPEITVFDAYIVVEPDLFRRAALSKSINIIEGRGQAREESLYHCVEIHREFGTSLDHLAAIFGLKPAWLKEHMRFLKFDERAIECGLGDLIKDRRFSFALKKVLAPIRSDILLTEVVKLIATGSLGPNDAKDIAHKVAKVRTERDGLKLIEDRRSEANEAVEKSKSLWGRRKLDIPTKAMMAVRRLVSVPHALDPARLQFSALQPAQLVRDLQAIHEAIEILGSWRREIKLVQAQQEKAKSWKRDTDGEATSSGTLESV